MICKSLTRKAVGEAIRRAESEIGDSVVMLSDEYPGIDFLGPKSRS